MKNVGSLRNWIRIKDFENYAINNKGVIVNWNTGIELKQYRNNTGTRYVRLWKNNKEYVRSVNSLLKQTFIGRYCRLVDDNHVYLDPVYAKESRMRFNDVDECAQYFDVPISHVEFALQYPQETVKGNHLMFI